MIRSSVAADVLAALQACLGPGCDYSLFRSRAIPPAECNSIAVTWGDSTPDPFTECDPMTGCDASQEISTLRIILTRCCVTADAGMSFNEAAEDDAAMCFWRDVETIECCLEAGDWRQLGIDHGITSFRRSGTRFDPQTFGGCTSAYIDIRVISEMCCP